MESHYGATTYPSSAKGQGIGVNEGLSIANQLKRMLFMMQRELEGLSDSVLNQELEIQPTNTLFQLGTHVAGSTRYWAITNLGGEDFHRNREAEFSAAGEGKLLLADLDLLIEQTLGLVSPLTAEQLNEPVSLASASISFWPESEPLSRRDAVLHALEHTGLHVGHAQITRQLLGFPPPGQDTM